MQIPKLLVSPDIPKEIDEFCRSHTILLVFDSKKTGVFAKKV